MELVIALLAGAAGGSIIGGASSKVAVSLWISLAGGAAGGSILYLLATKLLIPGGAKVTAAADVYSLFGLLTIGFAGGALALAPSLLRKFKNQR